MIQHRFSKTSLQRMQKLHPDMRKVVKLALKYSRYDFGVAETLRTVERQKELVASGASQTMRSRHFANEDGYSEAVDLSYVVNGKYSSNHKYYRKIAAAMFKAAFELGIPIEWGGHWESFVDSPHFQLSGGFN